jgi:crotonobetainyl-CoA:carnitine CoA-transferase CaiB-like acyl-CoA transferase
VGASWPDPLNGINATIALLAALRHRNRTGRGQHIDLAMAEGALATLPLGILETTATARPPALLGNRDPRLAPHNSYRCAGDDQWLVIAVEDEPQWRALCRATGHPEWAGDPRFDGMDARRANEDALDALLGAWCQDRDKSAAAALLRAAGVPAAASLDRAEVLADVHLHERGAFVAIDPSAGGPRRLVPAVPWHIDGLPARYQRPPTLGQDTEAVLGGLLGMSTTEIAGLRDSGALE